MRYKVRVLDDVSFDALHELLNERDEVLLASKRRRTLSTGELSDATVEAIRERGGDIVEDRQYEPDSL